MVDLSAWPDELHGVRLKCIRSISILEHLSDSVSSWCSTHEWGYRLDHDMSSDEYLLHVSHDPVPEEWSLDLGDAVHNLRTALDHLAHALVIRRGHVPHRRTAMPIYTRPPEGDAESAFRRLLPGATANDIELITSWQPYQSNFHPIDSHELAILSELDNLDKHRLLMGRFTTSFPKIATSGFEVPIYPDQRPPTGSHRIVDIYLGSEPVSDVVSIDSERGRQEGDDPAVIARLKLATSGPSPIVRPDPPLRMTVCFGLPERPVDAHRMFWITQEAWKFMDELVQLW